MPATDGPGWPETLPTAQPGPHRADRCHSRVESANPLLALGYDECKRPAPPGDGHRAFWEQPCHGDRVAESLSIRARLRDTDSRVRISVPRGGDRHPPEGPQPAEGATHDAQP